MRLVDYLDKGLSLAPDGPCLTTDGDTRTYAEVRTLAGQVAAALKREGIRPGDKVAILSANDPTAFTCVFGISAAGAVWCPINPRGEADENRQLLDLFDCTVLIFQSAFAGLVDQIRAELPKLDTLVCLDGTPDWALSWARFLGPVEAADPNAVDVPGVNVPGVNVPGVNVPGVNVPGVNVPGVNVPGVDVPGVDVPRVDVPGVEDVAMIVGTGGTTGRPKGVILTGRNLETMTAIVLMSYPFDGRPVYLALAPLTHAAGVLCFPVLTLGGEIVIMRHPDVAEFLEHIPTHRITHTFLPPTLIYMTLDHPRLPATDLASLQCFWYGAAPMSVSRLEDALTRIGPVMAQLFGQTEAPMMISTLAPGEHFQRDGTVARSRLASAGRPAPLVTVAIMDRDGRLLPTGQTGEIVVRSSLVMRGYYRDAEATAAASAHGWHHTGDIGYLDEDGFLFIVDRARDMVITGGFNVYSTEVEQALMAFPAVADCAVIGLPDEKWGERVTAVVQLRPGQDIDRAELSAFVKARLGSVKTPKQIEVWTELPRSKVGKVLKAEIKQHLLAIDVTTS